MTDQWIPPVTTPDEVERLTKIESGIPDYMLTQVRGWVLHACRSLPYGDWMSSVPEALTRIMKVPLRTDFEGFGPWLFERGSDELVVVIDCMLYHGLGRARANAGELNQILGQGRAGWTITVDNWGRPRVTERVPSGVRLAYESAMNTTALAGQLLAEAFEHAYGTRPNPGHSYMQSVKAVETLACPRFLPDNGRATLGSVIAHLNRKDLSLPLKEKDAPHRETLVRMMQILWQGADRHGGQDDYVDVSLGGAKAAHSIAVCLVQLLHEGLVS